MRIHTTDDLRRWVAADVARYELGTGLALMVGLAKTPQLRWQIRLRITECAANASARSWRALGAVLRWRLQSKAVRLGYTIPINVCGPGLKLPHWGTIVISGAARIGSGCTIHPSTSIGIHHGRAPRIGDRVYIGPGAKLFGAIDVGDDATVGANAVVTRSVPNGVTVHGVPARAH